MIRYIKKLELVESRFLIHTETLPGKTSVYVPYFIPWVKVEIVGLASMEVTEEVSGGMRKYTSKVAATLEKRLPHRSEPVALRLTDVEGNKYLLGTYEKPYPVITQEDKYAGKANEQSACTFNATLTGSYPACVIRN